MRFMSTLAYVVLSPLALAGAMTAAHADPDGAAQPGAANMSVAAVGSFRAPAAQAGGEGMYRQPYRYRVPVPQRNLNACHRSRPAFGDADFTFHGFDEAGVPC